MKIIKKIIQNIGWTIFTLSIVSMYLVLAHETGKGIFVFLAIVTVILMSGIYRPIIRFVKDMYRRLA